MKVALLVDPLSVTMCLFVTGVSALIHLYSIGYMHRERDYTKFFVYLNLFVFSMLLLVLADNLLITFIGWEGVGVCSYWLVSYYFDKDSAASAGKKAFLYNRVGDVGLLVAMFALFTHLHTLTYLGIAQGASTLSSTDVTLIVLLVLFAATGKSAQIPLFNWLPDAMEGPTPVSALIHAATMVTAGVYLLCRMNQVLVLSSTGRATIATIGAATAFIAATIATSQHDIKKVLAFSTVSQIGFMVLAVGSGAYAAAIFLMVAHAFYKGLLFLGAGSVIHGLDGEQELARMGGLRRLMAWTYGTFLVGWLTIAGVPPFSAFFAKGDVLKGAWSYSKPLWAIGVAAALLTAYYMTRLFVLAFTGDPRFLEAAGGRPALHPPHESPWVMRAAARRARRLRRARGAPRHPARHTSSRRCSRPRRPCRCPRRSPTRSAPSTPSSRSSASGSPGRCGAAASSAPSSRPASSCASGTGTTSTTRCSGGRRPRSRAPRPSVIDPVVIDGAVVGHRRRRPPRPRARCASCRTATCAATPSRSPWALALLIAYLLARTF